MRSRAQQAGTLQSSSEQTVLTQSSTIVIQPASPEVVYVPAYNPWLVYGDPIEPWPGWYPYPGIWFDDGPYVSFGFGFDVGWYSGFGWGWGCWGFDWHHRWGEYRHDRYWSRSRTFYNRDNFYRGRGAEGRRYSRDSLGARGYAEPRGQSGVRSGAFSGYEHGGETRSFSSRGSSSFGGGGFHGGRHR